MDGCPPPFQQALKWMDARRQSGTPFFTWVATNAPHAPYIAKPEDAALYMDKVDDPQLAHFYGMIHNIDENIGALLARLAQWGIERETLVIFMTDNGTAKGAAVFNAGMRGQKGSAWLGGTRVGQGRSLLWSPRPGRHRLELRRRDGSVVDRVEFEVRAMPPPRRASSRPVSPRES